MNFSQTTVYHKIKKFTTKTTQHVASTNVTTFLYPLLVEEQVEHFSLEQQLGNKSTVNKYHLPLAHDTRWCGNIAVWNEYAKFHHDVLHGRRRGKGYLRYCVCYK